MDKQLSALFFSLLLLNINVFGQKINSKSLPKRLESLIEEAKLLNAPSSKIDTATLASYLKGVEAIDKLEYSDGVKWLTKVIDQTPNHTNALYFRSWCYRELGKLKEAMDDIVAASSHVPNSALIHHQKGRTEAFGEQHNQAISSFSESLKLQPTLRCYHDRAYSYNSVGEFDKAIDDCIEIIKVNPEYTNVWVALGKAYQGLGYLDSAKVFFAIDHMINDSNNLGIYYLAKMEIEQQNDIESLEIINIGLEKNPSNYWLLLSKGDVYYGRGDYRTAIKYYKQVEEIKPNYFETNALIAHSYNMIGEQREALKYWDKAIKSKLGSDYPYRCRGATKRILGDLDGALDDSKWSCFLNPADYKNHLGLAEVLLELKKYEQVVSAANSVIAIDDTIHKAYILRADAHYFLGKTQKAIDDYSKVLQLQPNDAWTLYSRGDSYKVIGDYESSIEDLNNAVKLKPDVAKFRRELGVAYYLSDNFRLALDDLLLSLKKYPEDNRALHFTGLCYFKLDKFNESLDYFSQLIKKEGYGVQYHYRGLSYIGVGQTKRGCKDLKKAAETGYLDAVDAMIKYCE